MNTFKITFSNGDTITTNFNGTLEEAINYYVGKWFNLGIEDDLMVKGKTVEQIN